MSSLAALREKMILLRNERDEAIAERDQSIAERDRIIAERNRTVAERNRETIEHKELIAEYEKLIAEYDMKAFRIAEEEGFRRELEQKYKDAKMQNQIYADEISQLKEELSKYQQQEHQKTS